MSNEMDSPILCKMHNKLQTYYKSYRFVTLFLAFYGRFFCANHRKSRFCFAFRGRKTRKIEYIGVNFDDFALQTLYNMLLYVGQIFNMVPRYCKIYFLTHIYSRKYMEYNHFGQVLHLAGPFLCIRRVIHEQA